MSTPGSCDCGRRWAAQREAHCCVCHLHFATDSAFDRHLGTNGCTDPKRLRNKRGDLVFVLTERASGAAWAIREHRQSPFLKNKQAPLEVA